MKYFPKVLVLKDHSFEIRIIVSKIPPLVLAYFAGEASPASTWVWREALTHQNHLETDFLFEDSK